MCDTITILCISTMFLVWGHSPESFCDDDELLRPHEATVRSKSATHSCAPSHDWIDQYGFAHLFCYFKKTCKSPNRKIHSVIWRRVYLFIFRAVKFHSWQFTGTDPLLCYLLISLYRSLCHLYHSSDHLPAPRFCH